MKILTVITILTTLMVLGTIGSGVYFAYQETPATSVKLKKFLKINLGIFIPLVAAAFILFAPSAVSAATGETSASGLGYISAALATGIACLGSGYAVATVGSAALGAVSENEKIFGKTLIFAGLAEGIAIYGLIISIMIIGSL